MHELSIAGSLFDILQNIAKENNLKKIYKVTILAGRMRQIVPTAMEMAFTAVTAGSLAEGAKLEIEVVPIKMRCVSCSEEFSVWHNIYICPSCESAKLELLQGDELIVKNIEGED
ncbi:MAG: hydrogenase maturation nickel metallochaperone HypA [Spirochaetia bacterium]|jgi:hydrogenase nickel incorporation protein HypA/HybF|nr:hydrogenase maturation nickel metallochaperone HypA [Spirochaetia bacterium]